MQQHKMPPNLRGKVIVLMSPEEVIRYARDIHAAYAETPRYPKKKKQWDLAWVEAYDKVLAELRRLRALSAAIADQEEA